MADKIRILTLSSANMDFVMNVQKVPEGGQTLSDPGSYRFIPGGKGANSAVAVHRLGGESLFCTRVGNDSNGDALRAIYKKEGLSTDLIGADDGAATGLAVIMVEPSGQNRIIVFPGANHTIGGEDIRKGLNARPDALLMQLEIPRETVVEAANRAAAAGIPVVIDAGPADPTFPLDRLPELEIFSPNETEAKLFTGIDPADPASCMACADKLAQLVRAKWYVIKLGGRGCFFRSADESFILPCYDGPVVDTTAAGDAFTAALTLEYLRSGDMRRAGRFANVVGTLTVGRAGAMPSLPTAAEAEKFIADNGIRL